MKFNISGGMVITCVNSQRKDPSFKSPFPEYKILYTGSDFKSEDGGNIIINKSLEENIVNFIARILPVKWSSFFSRLSVPVSKLIEEFLIQDRTTLHISEQNNEVTFLLCNSKKDEFIKLNANEFEEYFTEKVRETSKDVDRFDQFKKDCEENFEKEESKAPEEKMSFWKRFFG